MGQIFPPWWNKLPIVAGIPGSLGLTLAIAGVWYCVRELERKRLASAAGID